jgi:hypothetical protein
MSKWNKPTRASGLIVRSRKDRTEGKVLGGRNIFVRLLLWPRLTGKGSLGPDKAKTSCLLHLFCLAKEHRSKLVFAACCLIVMAVSVHDAMLVVLNAEIILAVERNPVARWLIQLQRGDIWLFVLAKLLGTAIACSILVVLYEFRDRLALVAAGGVASFQIMLLYYLTFWGA